LPTAQINGVDLYYEIHGAGPTVVLSHGVGSNHLHWWQQVPVWSKHFQVITFDHRGFGFSKDDGRGPPAFVDDLIGLLDHLEISRTALVGQSMGGFTVAGVASRQPERISALVLSSSSAGLVKPRPLRQAVQEQFAKVTDYMTLAHVLLHQDGFPARKPSLCFLFEQMAQLNRNVNVAALPMLGPIRHDPAPLKAASIPVFLIGGEEDAGAHAAMREIAELFEATRLEIVPETGHLLFFEHAEAYNRLIEDFLAQKLLGRDTAEVVL
jgi:pimeloyl-ACP methyl ester carboxylesterase